MAREFQGSAVRGATISGRYLPTFCLKIHPGGSQSRWLIYPKKSINRPRAPGKTLKHAAKSGTGTVGKLSTEWGLFPGDLGLLDRIVGIVDIWSLVNEIVK